MRSVAFRRLYPHISLMNKACEHHTHDAPDGSVLSQALISAEARCSAAGERWTPPRKRVLELLLRAGGPVKAYDLIADFSDDGAAAKPPTVYRALDFLEGVGLAHRIPSLNAYVACGAAGEVHSASFLICDCCGSAEEFDPKIEASAQAEAERLGFRPKTMALEVRGLCRACAA
jgi:Fur family zinc uptake transcriptional regulator